MIFFFSVPWIITRPVLLHLCKYLWNRWQSVPGGLSLFFFFSKAHLWGNPNSWNLHLSWLNLSWIIGYHQDNVAPAGLMLINFHAQKASVIHIKYPPSVYVSPPTRKFKLLLCSELDPLVLLVSVPPACSLALPLVLECRNWFFVSARST